jgi:hypothetical protein
MIPFARTGLKPWTYFVMSVGNVGLPYSSKWKGLRLIQGSPFRALLESRRTKGGLLNSSLIGFRASTVEGEDKWESANYCGTSAGMFRDEHPDCARKAP